jgi:hypothetical protein
MPLRRQLDADSSSGSEEEKVLSQGLSSSVTCLPPLKKEKQTRTAGTGGGWFHGGGGAEGAVAFNPDAGEGGWGGAEVQGEHDDFGGWTGQASFQKRKPRAPGLKSSIAAAQPPAKVNTHFLAGTGVSDVKINGQCVARVN